MPLLLPLTGFILGLIIGSFANVVIWRLPRSKSMRGRSHCVRCLNKIPWHDLVPVASFLVLRGRCRRCGEAIKWLYPLVELYSGLVFALSFLFFGHLGLGHWLLMVFLLELFLILGQIDFYHLILPDVLILLMLAGTAALMIYQKYILGVGYGLYNTPFINNLLIAAILFLILFVPWLISGGRWLGLGDAKLAGAIGLAFGFKGALIAFYGAIVLGALVGLLMWLGHRATFKSKLPLGTFICIAATLYIFVNPWINRIIDGWLLTIFPTLYF